MPHLQSAVARCLAGLRSRFVNRTLKAGLLAVGLTGLLSVIALAARGSHPIDHGRVAPRPVPVTLQDSFVTLLEIAYVIVIIVILVVLFKRRSLDNPQESRWLRNFILVMMLSLVVAVLGSWAIRHGHYGHHQQQAQGGSQHAQSNKPKPGSSLHPNQVRPAKFQWPLAAGVAGLILLGGLLIFARGRRSAGPEPRGQNLQEQLIQTIDTTIDDLRREGDARKAVIASYASMERTLASHDFARIPAEAPLEYLSRILGTLEVRPDAVRSLTNLFEYAKFSRHDIDGQMKEAAIEALLTIREDLSVEESVAA
jgi:hypothetical protein